MSSWRGRTWQRRWRKFFAKEERQSGFKFCPKFWRTWIRDLKDSAAEILSILENIYILLDIMWQIITYVKCLCIFSNLKMHQVGWMEPPKGWFWLAGHLFDNPYLEEWTCSFISGRMLGPITVCVCVCVKGMHSSMWDSWLLPKHLVPVTTRTYGNSSSMCPAQISPPIRYCPDL